PGQIIDQVAALLHAVDNFGEHAGGLAIEGGVHADELGIGHDGTEKVVHIVGDAADTAADLGITIKAGQALVAVIGGDVYEAWQFVGIRSHLKPLTGCNAPVCQIPKNRSRAVYAAWPAL